MQLLINVDQILITAMERVNEPFQHWDQIHISSRYIFSKYIFSEMCFSELKLHFNMNISVFNCLAPIKQPELLLQNLPAHIPSSQHDLDPNKI